ncbi:MAG: hypothetical protein JGK17_07870 [Microcoleus sp. PH2017_10_PVI_O_A]|uniref:hypothetical protein n=1 Tax=unclassified Microcoleus TaxID=2642155 RepID=UPI001DA776D8|nr:MULTISPECIES: hypothetical protein [unclassified Microcoleus]TAE84325.1 MAG: hypothetical protein EAZ83_06455 [Oscillatoriales cyanobacterium]MCC3405499.1 hypothetical protein [Microcoleus sp. PH2017_10_PVI_O_A]MCC3461704.1 hypothetical protein [Microcoleus sp. PH2017_11_PCY_U_A]MCC3477601.1 hypothetical protein [Microcoleus sp. PH2017_12_PCY_D_A]MCC3529002.1 hypothetical protein [Microcoleus sp. PH2017_21_RUC_O_A]
MSFALPSREIYEETRFLASRESCNSQIYEVRSPRIVSAIAPSTLITEPPQTFYANLKTFFPIMTGALDLRNRVFYRD